MFCKSKVSHPTKRAVLPACSVKIIFQFVVKDLFADPVKKFVKAIFWKTIPRFSEKGNIIFNDQTGHWTNSVAKFRHDVVEKVLWDDLGCCDFWPGIFFK